jgi:beta-phosphoglucomutase
VIFRRVFLGGPGELNAKVPYFPLRCLNGWLVDAAILYAQSMLRAIIFDFDGIIVDSEPLIMRLTQRMAAREGWTLSEDDYYRNYLALDDRGIIKHLYDSHRRPIDHVRRDELVEWKTRLYAEAIREGLPPISGAVDFVGRVAAQVPLAIASGSLRSEVEHLLQKLGLREKFAVITTADDCERSKPDPEIFLKALERLRQLPVFKGGAKGQKTKREKLPHLDGRANWEKGERVSAPLQAGECLAIEDAPAGVRAAQAAGMKCLALAHSRPLEALRHADWACREFAKVDLEKIRAEFGQS